jgi:hypothetical protein
MGTEMMMHEVEMPELLAAVGVVIAAASLLSKC